MKIKFIAVFIAAGLISCGGTDLEIDKETAVTDRTPLDIFIFIDKSASVSFTDTLIKKRAIIKVGELVDSLIGEGDRISVYLIHNNTRGASWVYSYSLPPRRYPPQCSKVEKRLYDERYKAEFVKNRTKFYEEFYKYVDTPWNNITKSGTDIIGALEVMSRNLNPKANKYILLLTDGKQSTAKFKCDPRDNKMAIDIASKHLRAIPEEYWIQKEGVENSKVYMLLPYNSISSSHNIYLNTYWKKIFKGFEIDLIIE